MLGAGCPPKGPAPARSCRVTSRMPGRTAAAKSPGPCFSTLRPPPADLLKRSRSAARITRTNTINSSSATAGKSSAQTLFEDAVPRARPAIPASISTLIETPLQRLARRRRVARKLRFGDADDPTTSNSCNGECFTGSRAIWRSGLCTKIRGRPQSAPPGQPGQHVDPGGGNLLDRRADDGRF